MKLLKTFIVCLLLLTTFGIANSYAKDESKIGSIELGRLFDEYYKTVDYDKVLQQRSTDFDKARKEKVEKIQEEMGKLNALAADKKKEAEAKIEQMKAEALEFDRQGREDLTKYRNDKTREILLEIEGIVSKYAEKEGYSIILEDRFLIYGKDTINVTEPVLKILNENKPAAAK